ACLILYSMGTAIIYWPLHQFLPIYMVEKNKKPLIALKDILREQNLGSILKGSVYLFLYLVMSVAVGMAVAVVVIIAALLAAIPMGFVVFVLGMKGHFVLIGIGGLCL